MMHARFLSVGDGLRDDIIDLFRSEEFPDHGRCRKPWKKNCRRSRPSVEFIVQLLQHRDELRVVCDLGAGQRADVELEGQLCCVRALGSVGSKYSR